VAASTASQRTAERYGVDPVTIGRIIEKQESDKSEVERHRVIEEINMWVKVEEANLEVEKAFLAALAPAEQIEKLTAKFRKTLEEWEYWYLKPESQARTFMLERLSKNIRVYNEAIDAKGHELVSGDSRYYRGSVEEEPSDSASERVN
jgi:hypothetical protein